MKQRAKRRAALAALVLLALGAAGRLGLSAALPDSFALEQGQPLAIAQMPWLQPVRKTGSLPAAGLSAGSSYDVQLSLWGVLPVKTVRASVVQRPRLMASGQAFGLKMFSAGVMAVSFTDIPTEKGYKNPAKEAGILLGDYLDAIDGVPLRTNEQVKKIVEESGGRPLTVTYSREGSARTARVQPVKDKVTGRWRMGVWVRDSSAGIGTLTWFDPESRAFGGLGHSVTDVDTGESLTLSAGEIVPVTISGAVPGTPGIPGELRGSFDAKAPAIGSIRKNSEAGLYGLLYTTELTGLSLPAALMQEIRTGPAQILSTIDEKGPRFYDVTIEKITYTAADPNKNMRIRVTDASLIAATGGIVQGMSGSPVIQNGRIVGAVTHVLVNDPTRGYGIFIENMLDVAE